MRKNISNEEKTIEELYLTIATWGYWVNHPTSQKGKEIGKMICEAAYKELCYRRIMAL